MTDALTVLRAQTGDRDALDELLRSVQEPLFRYALRLTGDRPLAEDVLQEVFVLIYRKLRWLDDPSLFRAWAYRIASREAFRALRRERRWREQVRDQEVLEAVAASPAPEPSMIESMIDRLSPASRAVVILHYLEDLPARRGGGHSRPADRHGEVAPSLRPAPAAGAPPAMSDDDRTFRRIVILYAIVEAVVLAAFVVIKLKGHS